jgi:hypothetical protein
MKKYNSFALYIKKQLEKSYKKSIVQIVSCFDYQNEDIRNFYARSGVWEAYLASFKLQFRVGNCNEAFECRRNKEAFPHASLMNYMCGYHAQTKKGIIALHTKQMLIALNKISLDLAKFNVLLNTESIKRHTAKPSNKVKNVCDIYAVYSVSNGKQKPIMIDVSTSFDSTPLRSNHCPFCSKHQSFITMNPIDLARIAF